MSGLTKILLYFIASVAFAVLIAPLVIKLMSKPTAYWRFSISIDSSCCYAVIVAVFKYFCHL